jgi:fused signal recognition particle receptor
MNLEKSEKKGLFQRLKAAVQGTRDNLLGKIENIVFGKKEISPEMLDDLEAVLIGADIGVAIATEVIENTRQKVARQLLRDPNHLKESIRQELLSILQEAQNAKPSLSGEASTSHPWVVMVVGVNGTGKTTTLGKLANRYMSDSKSVLICAADTFRAAAVEQLAVWAKRAGAEMIHQSSGGNPSAVIFDGLQAAVSRKVDIVLVDTAGRLHTKSNLMQELEKMKRIAERQVPGAPHEVLLVLDATTGQNGLIQAKEFIKASGVSGLVVTKLDGTAKGGVVFSIVREFKTPIQYVGIGEKIDDLIEFSPEAFVDGIFMTGNE